ncbi:DMT family transporter [Streptomyces sp. Li-HN-5-11]|uniref:DMT family transporter n=1 Tax=Streptomyces sp. Li-HN-5-11 TaxID=3075432 RepID=UPI0028AFD9EF|nr:DMT family transporter [Streptomyces sp. Li-HN-5-11]WNM33216.1 DMT family transporter [Streptomyces sp. Li-HN-5-11]
MLSVLLAVLAAVANALASALQRKAAREEPAEENLSLRLVGHLLHRPVWLAGVSSLIAGFLLQAVALGAGQISLVQPVLALDLPAALILSGLFLGSRLGRREWGASAVMAAGVAGLLFALGPGDGKSSSVSWLGWLIGCGANALLILAGVLWARAESGTRRAAVLGATTGCAFGMTAALIKGVTDNYAHGLAAVFTGWQLWAMIAVGACAMFLLQSAMQAGRLLATQPGLTMVDPVIGILWGVLIFHETVRGGPYIVLAVAAAAAAAAAVTVLSRSPLLSDEAGRREDAGRDAEACDGDKE